MASSVNLADLGSNLGNYYRESTSEIYSDVLLGLENSIERTGITVADNVKDQLVLTNVIVGDVIRPGGNENFVPSTNNINLNNRILQVRPVQADIKLVPQQFEATWLSTIRKSKGHYNQDNFPLYEFIAKQLNKKISQEIRNAMWRATYNASGVNWSAVFTGYLSLIAADVTAGKIVEVATGVVTKDNVVAAIEDTVAGLGEGYRDIPGKCMVARTLFDWYVKAPEAQFGRTVLINELSGGSNALGQQKVYIRGTNIELVPEFGLGASQRIIATTDENFWYGTDVMDEYNKVTVQPFDRYLKVMYDFKAGVQYSLANAVNRPISVNDQP